MRILFICENYLPHYGGVELLFKNLAERYVKKGHQVTILTHRLKGTKRKEIINGVRVHRVQSFFSRYVFTFFALPQAIRLARNHDLIQTTSFNGAPPAWLAGKLCKKPVVITVHEVWVGKWKEITGFSWWISQIHELLERAIYHLPYTRYICVSESTKNDLLRIGINKDKVEKIYNGFDYNFWNPNNFDDEKIEKIRERLNLKEKFIYFSWGRPGPSKGFQIAIRAVPLIKKTIPNSLFLLMLGSADKYARNVKKLNNLIRQLHLTPNDIKIIPSVPYNELGYYIKIADCVVIPSVSEGFGYAALEGIAMAKPVVASNAGSLPEVVSGKYQIFRNKDYSELAEKVISVRNGRYQQRKKKYFSWEETVGSYLKVYQSLLLRR